MKDAKMRLSIQSASFKISTASKHRRFEMYLLQKLCDLGTDQDLAWKVKVCTSFRNHGWSQQSKQMHSQRIYNV